MSLNQRAAALCRPFVDEANDLRVAVHRLFNGATIVDLGIDVPGGIEAGRRLAETCLAGLGVVGVATADSRFGGAPVVTVRTDHPALACMASQYAGWQVSVGRFFAMGSGPMRALARKEPLFARLAYSEKSKTAVGILETRQLPDDDVAAAIAEQCRIEPDQLTLLAAPTASQAGTLQVVARSVETALHKLDELGFDVRRVESGFGQAPLPPVAADDLAAIGRTNDAILYGGETTLWVRGDDADIERIGPRVPSNASADHGQPFRQVFEKYDRDFYKIDPSLFSPAVVTFCNLDTGRRLRFGELAPEVVARSFDG